MTELGETLGVMDCGPLGEAEVVRGKQVDIFKGKPVYRLYLMKDGRDVSNEYAKLIAEGKVTVDDD